MLAKGKLPIFYGHCIDNAFKTGKPYITITSHFDDKGNTVWNIGGDIAENKNYDNTSLREITLLKFKKALPYLDLSQIEWGTYEAIRGEAKTKNGHIPESIEIKQYGNVLICWPTKLVLSPLLADKIESELKVMNMLPSYSQKIPFLNNKIYIASTPWE